MARAKKKKTTLLILVIVLVALAAVYGAVTFLGGEEEPSGLEQVTTLPLISVNPGDVEAFSYTLNGEELSFENTADKGWVYAPQPELSLNMRDFELVLGYACDVQAERAIEEGASLSDYGLDPPLQVITLTMKDGEVITYDFGRENTATKSYYLKLSDSDTVYSVKRAYGTYFSKGLMELASVENVPKIYMKELETLRFKNENGEIRLRYLLDGDPSVYTDEIKWFFDEPDGLVPADNVACENLFNAVVGGLFMEESAATGVSEEDLAQYGLDDPYMELDIDYVHADYVCLDEATETWGYVYTDMTYSLDVGDLTEDGLYRYGKLAGSDKISLMRTGWMTNAVAAKKSDLQVADAALISAEKLEGLDVKVGNTSYRFEFSRKAGAGPMDEPEILVSLNGEEISGSTFTGFYNALYGLRAEQFLDQPEAPVSDAFVTVVYHQRKGEDVTLSLSQYNLNFYLATMGDTGYQLMSIRDVEKIISRLEAL